VVESQFDAGAHGLAAPLVEELAGSELLKCFLEKICPDGF
jgi:hypothetical protein